MKKESEAYIQYIWANKLLKSNVFRCTENRQVEILSWGVHNLKENGPDFKFACIRYQGLKWYGHIEVHQRSSDWLKHCHHQDPQYQNVILHVVRVNDSKDAVFSFPTIVLQDDAILPNRFYSKGTLSKSIILCGMQISESIFKDKFIFDQLLSARMFRKANEIKTLDLKKESISGFGKNTNVFLFRYIADNWHYSAGLSILEFIKINKQTVEKLVVTKNSYGNARMNQVFKALEAFVLQFCPSFFIISPLQNATKIITNFMRSTWFNDNRSIGYFLLINIWLPFFLRMNSLNLKQIIALLVSFPREENTILSQWKNYGISSNNAFESQAILEIYSQLCKNKKCLSCPLGKELLS